jgi:valyl-tRNA synthetase
MVAEFPKVEEGEIQPGAEAEMELVMSVIGAVRNLRSELNIPPAKQVEVVLQSKNGGALNTLERNRIYVGSLARATQMAFQPEGEKPRASATSVVGDVEVFLPLKGLINLDEEEKRIQKEISKVAEELSRINLKMHNEEFLRKAKTEAVEKERERAKVLVDKEAKLKEGLGRVRAWKKIE